MYSESPDSGLRKWIPLLWFQISSFGSGFAASVAINDGLGFWYQTLRKPEWSPPTWLFGPLWTILYFLLGYAAWQVWRTKERTAIALTLYGFLLVLNTLNAWLSFGWRQLYGSVWASALLAVLALLTAAAFFRARPVAGWLMLPYLLWVCFLAALNYTLWRMNS